MKSGKQINKDDVIRKIRDVIEKDNSILFAYLHGSFLESNWQISPHRLHFLEALIVSPHRLH